MRSFVNLNAAIYNTMQGPSEFTVTRNFKDWDWRAGSVPVEGGELKQYVTSRVATTHKPADPSLQSPAPTATRSASLPAC